tara:strand:+ start:6201 stop:7139 length:939 start_codon:yes stop_codon:yes gene_type:complete
MKKLTCLTTILIALISCSNEENPNSDNKEIDNTVTVATGLLTSNADNESYTYQWLDCGDNIKPVLGATNRIFEPIKTGTYAVKITNDDCTAISECYFVEVCSPKIGMIYFHDDSTGVEVEKSLDTINWHHIAFTKASDRTGQLFINGEEVASGNFSDLPFNYTKLHLGANFYTSWTDHYKGWLDDLRISDTIRSKEQIKEVYASDKQAPIDHHTIGLYDFNSNSGSDINNSANGVSGTLYNGASFTKGKYGNAIYFDGVDDYADCNLDIPEEDITIEFWIKLDGLPKEEGATVVQPYGLYNSNINVLFKPCN